MCKNIEKLLEKPVNCQVSMDGEVYATDDFVAVLADKDGNHALWYNTDFITLSIAANLINEAMEKMLSEMTEEEIEELTAMLEEACDE